MSAKQADGDSRIRDRLRGLHRLLGHRGRLGICVLLARNDELSFSRLKEILEETDGNLGAHLRKLEEAAFIRVRKEFRDRKPVSWYALTPEGRRVLTAHIEAMSHLTKE